MRKQFEIHNLSIPIKIGIAPKYLSHDVAMFELLTGLGDENISKYDKKSFIDKIESGNVLVVLLKDDPIAYAVIKNVDIEELYISYSFRFSELEELMQEYVRKNF